MRVSAYSTGGNPIPDVAGAVLIFLHDFYDSPHVYHDLVFVDFWDWICFTITTLSDAGIPFWIEPHPNQVSFSEGVLIELKQRFPAVNFISSGTSNIDLVEVGILCGVTVYGTVAHELAYLGVPTITCARHPHVGFDFCMTAKSVEQYKNILIIPNLSMNKVEMRKQALNFYYMHNLYGSHEKKEFKPALEDFFKICDDFCEKPCKVGESLLALTNLPFWRQHITVLIAGLNHS